MRALRQGDVMAALETLPEAERGNAVGPFKSLARWGELGLSLVSLLSGGRLPQPGAAEVGRSQVGRGGIVRDPSLHRQVLDKITSCVAGNGWGVQALSASPLPGADGNREFLIAATRD